MRASRVAAVLLLVAVSAGVSGAASAADHAATAAAGTVPWSGAGAPEPVPNPTVTGPIAGTPVTSSLVALSPYGYVQQEYFVRGTATRYVQAGQWGSNGRWKVKAAATAPYKTRILVRRPVDPAHFNGTVVVEWLDSPGGVDADIEYDYEVHELLSAGYAWVGVSTSVDSSSDAVQGLQELNPARYASLTFPGISYSYSIFSQVAKAIEHPGGVAPLGGLRPRALIADGDSGGAHLLLTYYNAIQPINRLFSGFLTHSRATSSEPISEPGVRSKGQTGPQPPKQPNPAIVHIRTDLPTPFLDVQTQFDVVNHLGYQLTSYPSRQPDGRNFRLWELAGTPHGDMSVGAQFAPPLPRFKLKCKLPRNDGGQQPYEMATALAALTRWVRQGVPPREYPLLDVVVKNGHPQYVHDRFGNVEGGVRTPDLQVPIAKLTGSGNSGVGPPGGLNDACLFYGTSTPFSSAQLHALYPTHDDYVNAVRKATWDDVKAGILLPTDAWAIIETAQYARVP